MCVCSATFFYGITVKALDLCIAGRAFAEIKPTLLAIDLILARKAAGSLATTAMLGQVDVCALPVEVWDMIKLKLSALSYADQCACLEEEYHPGWSIDSYWEEDEEERADEPLIFANLLSNERGAEHFLDEGGVPAFLDQHEKGVADMLEYFGLCRPSPALISKAGESAFLDLDVAWPVAVRLVSNESKDYPLLEMATQHDVDLAQCVLRFSPSAFELAAGAAGRFRHLLASFPAVSPTSSSTNTIRSPTETTPALAQDEPAVDDAEAVKQKPLKGKKAAKQRRARERARRRALDRVERKAASVPAWMLYGSCGSCA